MTHPTDAWNTVYHDSYHRCLQAILNCHSTYGAHTPRSLRIVGFPGTGKTWLIEEVLRRLPATRDDFGPRIPALRVEIPSPPTIKTLLMEILAELKDPAPTSGTLAQMEHRVLTLLRNARVELLLVDEVQHFVIKGSRVPVDLTANMFKTLINKTRLPVVLLGAPSSRKLFRATSQLRSRIPQELSLHAFQWDDPTDRAAFFGIVKRQFPLGFENDEFLFQSAIARGLWVATYGILRPLSFMLKELRDMAPKEKVLNSALLSEAFRARIFDSAPANRDPFDAKFDGRLLVHANEPYEPEHDEGDAHGVLA